MCWCVARTVNGQLIDVGCVKRTVACAGALHAPYVGIHHSTYDRAPGRKRRNEDTGSTMSPSTADTSVMPRWLRGWEQFWFTPADPSVLALIRITCGMIVVYTLLVYSFTLQEFMGEHAWNDLELQREKVHDVPRFFAPLNWNAAGPLPEPKTEFQAEYKRKYRNRFGVWPPPPYPTDQQQANYLDAYRL